MKVFLNLFIIALVLSTCNKTGRGKSFLDEHTRWQEQRIERLRSRNGWLNLAGLYWLQEGENSFGSDSSNSIVFPVNAPPFLGKYTLEGGQIRFTPDSGAEVRTGDSLAGEMIIGTDRSGNVTVLESGSLAWFIIDRSPLFGIRLRDYDHPAIEEFHGIEYYPADEDWLVNAEYVPFDEPRELLIPTVVGTMEKNMCPGILKFSIEGKEQVLYPSSAGKGLFIVFADETSGLETYGGGRFLYTSAASEDNKVLIDFNRAYNPPCAFTPFATCPLPPRENILSVAIEAGEKKINLPFQSYKR